MTDEQVRRLEERLDANAAAIDLMAEQLDKVRTVDLPEIRVDIGGLRVTARVWGVAAGIVASTLTAGIVAWVFR